MELCIAVDIGVVGVALLVERIGGVAASIEVMIDAVSLRCVVEVWGDTVVFVFINGDRETRGRGVLVNNVDLSVRVSVTTVIGSFCVEVIEILIVAPAVTEESSSDVSTTNDVAGNVKISVSGAVVAPIVIKDPAEAQTDKLVFVTGTTALVVVPDSFTSVTQFASISKQYTAVVG